MQQNLLQIFDSTIDLCSIYRPHIGGNHKVVSINPKNNIMKAPEHFNIFYSWQSDLNKHTNNYFIKDCLEKSIKELKKEGSVSIIPRLDKDTQGMTGSPKITDTILSKIDASNIFICDISIINSNWLNKIFKKRLSPNPNVLFELGYALDRLSWDRIICLNNDAFSNIENMPFDLQQNRISKYNFNGKSKKAEAKAQLIELLKNAIKGIIENYQSILDKNLQSNRYQHDIKVFLEFDNLINDISFREMLKHIANVNIVLNDDYKLFNTIYEYLIADRNQFLVTEIQKEAIELAVSINKMHLTLAKNLQSKFKRWYDETEQKQMKQISFHLPDNEEYFKSYKEFEDNRNKRIDENTIVICESLNKYKSFRAVVKEHLFI